MPSSAVPGLTESTARAQIYDDLKKTLDGLPAGSSWSLASDVPPPQPFDRGIVVACSDSGGASSDDTPANVEIDYWLNGVPHGAGATYFKAVNDSVRRQGGLLNVQHSDMVAYQRNGYALNVVISSGGTVSVSVTSPCFVATSSRRAGDQALQSAQPKVINKSYRPTKH